MNEAVTRAARIIECLHANDFRPMTVPEIAAATGLPSSTAYRLLKSWEALGWVQETPAASTGKAAWTVSARLLQIAAAYERQAQEQIQRIRSEFLNVTGRELRA